MYCNEECKVTLARRRVSVEINRKGNSDKIKIRISRSYQGLQ